MARRPPALVLALAAGALAALPILAPGDPPAPELLVEQRESALSRVAVVGASASAGFLCLFPDHPAPVTLDRALWSVLADETTAEFSLSATPMFFTNSREIGPALLADALATRPTLLVALDFLFWFAYGNVDANGRWITDESQRLALFDAGLRLLDRFEGPMVVGDIPDMTPAIGLMLSRSQVPQRETLAALNARLREWAGARPRVIIMPIAELIEEIRAGDGLTIGPRSWDAQTARTLILPDNLHPSPQGQIVSAIIIADLLAERLPDVEASHFNTNQTRAAARLKAQP